MLRRAASLATHRLARVAPGGPLLLARTLSTKVTSTPHPFESFLNGNSYVVRMARTL